MKKIPRAFDVKAHFSYIRKYIVSIINCCIPAPSVNLQYFLKTFTLVFSSFFVLVNTINMFFFKKPKTNVCMKRIQTCTSKYIEYIWRERVPARFNAVNAHHKYICMRLLFPRRTAAISAHTKEIAVTLRYYQKTDLYVREILKTRFENTTIHQDIRMGI